jgi:hypothetical protein
VCLGFGATAEICVGSIPLPTPRLLRVPLPMQIRLQRLRFPQVIDAERVEAELIVGREILKLQLAAHLG